MRDGWRSNGGEGDGVRYSVNSKHADWEIKIQSKAKMCRNVQWLKVFIFTFTKVRKSQIYSVTSLHSCLDMFD